MLNTLRVLSALLFSLLLLSCAQKQPVDPRQLEFPELSFQPPKVDVIALDNGIRLFLKEDNELPLVQMTAMLGAGAITMPGEKKGFGDLFGKTWRTGGAGNRSPQELDDYLEDLAANLSASMGPYSSKLGLSLRSQDLDQGVSIIADMLLRPGFDEEKMELAKLQSLESIRRQNDDPGAISRRLLLASLYPDHYLGDAPTVATIEAVSRQDLVDFHKTYFAPNVLWIAVSGDFEREQLLALLQKAFGDWQSRDVPEQVLTVPDRPEKASVLVAARKLPQTTIVIGDVGLTKDNPDQYAVRVMNYILGGGGFNSRLMREIRSDRGLAYSAYSYFQIGRRLPGPFVAGTETKSESVVEALTLARDIMAEMRTKKVSEQELRLAKESLINSFVFGFENSHSVVTRRMEQEFHGYPPDYLAQYRDRIADVTVDDVLRVAERYINLSRQQVVLVGDLDSFGENLERAGFEYREVDLNDAL